VAREDVQGEERSRIASGLGGGSENKVRVENSRVRMVTNFPPRQAPRLISFASLFIAKYSTAAKILPIKTRVKRELYKPASPTHNRDCRLISSPNNNEAFLAIRDL
jgi:hypothetical protein